jgi:transcriptional regulator with XRE-family HTH domain
MNFQDVLDKVCNGVSDNKTSQKLGVSRVMFSRYRNGHRLPSNDMLDKMVELSGLSPVEVYLAAYAEKIDNPQVAEQFRHLVA